MTLPPRLSRMSLLLTLLLLAPRVGLAAEQPPEPPPDAPTAQAAPSADAPLPDVSAPLKLRLPDSPTAAPERPAQPLRVLAEVGAGALTGVGGLLVGYVATFALLSGGFGSGSIYALALPVLAGVGTGLALGTYWGGQVTGGEAELGKTFLGMLIGGAAGIVLSLPMDNPTMGLLLTPPLMLLGSIIGYENSEQGGIPTRIQPMLSVSSRGAMMGLAATF